MNCRNLALKNFLSNFPQQERALVGGCLATYGLNELLKLHCLEQLLDDTRRIIEVTNDSERELGLLCSNLNSISSRTEVQLRAQMREKCNVREIMEEGGSATPLHQLANREIKRLIVKVFNEMKASAHGIRLPDFGEALKRLFLERAYKHIGGHKKILEIASEHLPPSMQRLLNENSELGTFSESPSLATFSMGIQSSEGPMKVLKADVALSAERWFKVVVNTVQQLRKSHDIFTTAHKKKIHQHTTFGGGNSGRVRCVNRGENRYEDKQRDSLQIKQSQLSNQLPERIPANFPDRHPVNFEEMFIPSDQNRSEKEEAVQREIAPTLSSHISAVRRKKEETKKSALKVAADRRIDQFKQGDKDSIKRRGRGAMMTDILDKFLESNSIRSDLSQILKNSEPGSYHSEQERSEGDLSSLSSLSNVEPLSPKKTDVEHIYFEGHQKSLKLDGRRNIK